MWINPSNLKAMPEIDEVEDTTPGFEEQKWKLIPMDKATTQTAPLVTKSPKNKMAKPASMQARKTGLEDEA